MSYEKARLVDAKYWVSGREAQAWEGLAEVVASVDARAAAHLMAVATAIRACNAYLESREEK